ncbi:MAG: site-specific integrase [Clostridia bacterium]|nr:site-specific integrase [Clostridia bacterium]
MRELMAQYEESLRGQNLSENTLSSYLRDLEAFFGYL